jgi:hypothetical protein
MDSRVKILIEGVRKTHTSMLWFPKEVFPNIEPACGGCLDGVKAPVVLLKDCPSLKAADELEKEYGTPEGETDA